MAEIPTPDQSESSEAPAAGGIRALLEKAKTAGQEALTAVAGAAKGALAPAAKAAGLETTPPAQTEAVPEAKLEAPAVSATPTPSAEVPPTETGFVRIGEPVISTRGFGEGAGQ